MSSDGEEHLIALVERHPAGNPNALDALLRELYPMVRRIVFRLAGPRVSNTHDDRVQTRS